MAGKGKTKDTVMNGLLGGLPGSFVYIAVIGMLGILFSYSLTFSYPAKEGKALSERVYVLESRQDVNDANMTFIRKSLERIEGAK